MEGYRNVEQVRAEFAAAPRKALIITTVTCESRAVNSHLSDLERISGSNGTIYYKGRYAEPAGDWQIIHAITQAGNSDASAVATKAHGEFGKFDVQMFIGVAGSLKEDIPIGSVVAGEYVYNAHSGKVDDKGYYSRPHGHPAAPELSKAAQLLILEGDWVSYIRDPLPTKLPPANNYPCPFPPEAFLKSIASGEQVVAGGKTPLYRVIRKNLNDAGAVEMEGFGAMSAAHQEKTSAIIVRGISDMCAGKDHQSDAQHQPVASAHAAAFAFAILSIRSKASPSDTSGFPSGTEQEKGQKPKGDRIDFVINFRGEREDWSASDVDRIINKLKTVTGDLSITLVRIDQGSVRLVVSVRESDIDRLTFESLRLAAEDRAGLLLGAGTLEDLAAANEARAALRDASTNLYQLDQTIPGLMWLERTEKQQIEDRFRSESSSTVLLGAPGSGKSALLASIATELVASGEAILAIKADLISVEIHDEENLKNSLQLPRLPSELISEVARIQPVYVLIDQLDALASQLDLKSDRLNVLLNLARRVGGLPNVHILLSSRTFEFNHDVRLRAIAADPVNLSLPAWHEVRQALIDAGVDPDSWPENAREAIRNPQALKTYLSLDCGAGAATYSKYQSMLEQLWRQKVINNQDGKAMASLATDLAGTMAEEETLWLAASRYDEQAITLDRLESTGLIIRSKGGMSIAFSHQTVFDFVLARSFVRTSGGLSSYVLERQNSLFVRGKMWSALRYLRDAELSSYQREFESIWNCSDLRRHLRLLLIEFLGEVSAPAPFEITSLEQAIDSSEFHIAALRSCIGNPDWFSQFAQGPIAKAMAGDETESNMALRILQRAWTANSDVVIELLQTYWLPHPSKDSFTWLAIDACTSWSSDVEDIARTILMRTPISIWQVDYTSSTIGLQAPETAFCLIRNKLSYLLGIAHRTPEGKPYPTEGSLVDRMSWLATEDPAKAFESVLETSEWQSVPALSEAHPRSFLQTLWPCFKEIFEAIQKCQRQAKSGDLYPGLYTIDFDFEDVSRSTPSREAPLLSSLRLAVEEVAKSEADFFLTWADDNSEFEFAPVQRLIAHGLAASPELFADKAYDWLLADRRRLRLGTYKDVLATTLDLVREVSWHWSEAQLLNFEATVFHYSPTMLDSIDDADARRKFNLAVRGIRTRLLNAIPEALRTGRANELIATERRALGGDLDRVDHSSRAMYIGPPMTSDAMSKAKDSDILKIFREIPDETGWDHPSDWMRGGNIQLSRAFADFSKKEPVRALNILHQFEPGSQERAAGYALDSMAEDEKNDKLLQGAFLALYDRGFSSQEFRSSSSHAIEKIADRNGEIVPTIAQRLITWLEDAPRIIEDEAANTKEIDPPIGDEGSTTSSLLWGLGGMSILPDGNFPILSALTSILLRDGEEGRDRLIAVLTDHLARESDRRVWQALLIRLSHSGGQTPKVVSEFVRALFVRHPSLLETREAIYFLAYAQAWDSALVSGLISTWGEAGTATRRQAQGELVGLISITNGSGHAQAMQADLVQHGSEEAKVGLAYAGANLWSEPRFHEKAGDLLRQLIPGSDRERASAILDVFRLSSELRPELATLNFLDDLLDPSFDLSAAPLSFFVESLQTLLPHAASTVGSLALKIVNTWRGELADIRSSTSIAAPQLTDLALTLHRLGGEPREAGVAVFEALLDIDAYGARETLTEIDGRFGLNPVPPRRRVSRTQRRPRNALS